MLKGNSYILVFSVFVFLIIIFVSSTPTLMKALLFMIGIGFLFPIIRKILFKDKFRKIKVAFYSSLTFTIGLLLFSFLSSSFGEHSFNVDGELIGFFMIVLFFSLIGNFCYGLPVSLIAEWISMRFSQIRFFLSGILHIGFGLVTYLIAPFFFIPALIYSIIFFGFDEVTRRNVAV